MPKSAVNEISRGVFQLGHGPNSIILTIEGNKLKFSRQPAKLHQEGDEAKGLILEIDGKIVSTEGAPSTGEGCNHQLSFLTTEELEELFNEHEKGSC